MASCNSCGGADLEDAGIHVICRHCGNVDDTLDLVGDSYKPLMSTFMRYANHHKTAAYRQFEDLYRQCTHTLNSPQTITDEGLVMLPRLWENIKTKGMKTKRLYLFSLLYLLYRQHHVPATFSQFLKRAQVSHQKMSVSKIVHNLMGEFNLTMSKDMNVEDVTCSNIRELVKLVFKHSTAQMERDTIAPALRLVNIIIQKEWGDTTSKNYIALMCIIATLLSAQYVISNMTDRKTKMGRNSSFRIMTINYQKMADHMSVHVMAVKKCLKVIQRKLFELVKRLPWRAARIKRSYDVALVLDDILSYIDVDLQHEDYEETPSIPPDLKETLIDTTVTYISTHSEIMQETRPQIDSKEFMNILRDKLLCGRDTSDENVVILTKEGFVVQGSVIKFHYIELLKDLLLSGCSETELRNENYIKLVETYIDMDEVSDEEVMEEVTDEEMVVYLKNPSVVSIVEKVECNSDFKDVEGVK